MALGDSQTYGSGVLREQAWPQQFQEVTGLATYNMGFGGYGPVHSLLLLDEALALEPKHIIEAFYTGNDLFDAFKAVYLLGQLPAWKSGDRGVLEQVAASEQRQSLEATAGTLLYQGMGEVSLLRAVLSYYSKLYGLLRAIKRAVIQDTNPSWSTLKREAERDPGLTLAFENKRFRTVLTPRYRLTALNLGDPRIREGQRLANLAMVELAIRARRSGATYAVMVIPTKERVFAGQVEAAGRPVPREYELLLENEDKVLAETAAVLRSNGIMVVDGLACLTAALGRDVQPYDETVNGHPNAAGQAVLARCAQELIEKRPINPKESS